MAPFPQQLQHGSGVEVSLDPTRILLALREPLPRDQLGERLRIAGLALDGDGERDGRPGTEQVLINETDRRHWVRTVDRSNLLEDLDARLSTTGLPVDWAGPVYAVANVPGPAGRFCPLPYVLLVRSADNGQRLDPQLAEFGLEIDEERSRYLGDYRYARVRDRGRNAYELRDLLIEKHAGGRVDVRFENMPMALPVTVTPDDPLFAQQWNMAVIGAQAAWDISTGAPTVVVCVLDEGCDQTHPDLQLVPGGGINLGSMSPPGAPTGPHGTACAGIVAARFNNAQGVSGVAGNCLIMPAAFENWTDVEVASGINYAHMNGAAVISMSFGVYAPGDGHGPIGWDFTVINPAINAASAAGLVLVAATGNEDTNMINRYPARNPLVIAVGATDQVDNRKSPSSPDGECWGANWGPDISVCAPGVRVPTTDVQGSDGYNPDGAAGNVACVDYDSLGDAAGDYFLVFDGTSAATPHVAGLAALLRSQYPTLSNDQIRTVIERTAAKVGGPYADASGFPNGTRTPEIGYGRISLQQALDFADVMIRDYPGDDGAEPSNPPGNQFWDTSDIVIRPTDDGIFMPGNPAQSSQVQRGRTNYLYVRVTNVGPAVARNITVDARIAAYVGTEFVYPGDWTAIDANHVQPTPLVTSFATIPAGSSNIARFSISAEQVDTLWNWEQGMGGHPCLLAKVNAANDYAFTTAASSGAPIVVRRNNLAQRNLTVIPAAVASTVLFPFLIGSEFSDSRFAEIVVDRGSMSSKATVLLALEPRNHHQRSGMRILDPTFVDDERDVVFIDRTRVQVRLGHLEGLVTMESGSRFHYLEPTSVEVQYTRDGEIIMRHGERMLEARGQVTSVGITKRPKQQIPAVLYLTIPADAKQDERFAVTVTQRNEHGEVVGGTTFMAVAQPAIRRAVTAEAEAVDVFAEQTLPPS